MKTLSFTVKDDMMHVQIATQFDDPNLSGDTPEDDIAKLINLDQLKAATKNIPTPVVIHAQNGLSFEFLNDASPADHAQEIALIIGKNIDLDPNDNILIEDELGFEDFSFSDLLAVPSDR